VSPTFDPLIGATPRQYARRVLQRCGITEPPIDERAILHELQLPLQEFDVVGQPDEAAYRRVFQITPGWLKWASNGGARVYIFKEVTGGRRRITIVHESGHYTLPWHHGFSALCPDVPQERISHLEREAFDFASEALMPTAMFIPDALSLAPGVAALRTLAGRYDASLEATAIWYVRNSPRPTAMALVEPYGGEPPSALAVPSTAPAGAMFWPELPPVAPNTLEAVPAPDGPLQVRYFVASRRYPTYTRPRTRFGEDTFVCQCWRSGRAMRGVVPAAQFGSSQRIDLDVDCVPIAERRRVLVLIHAPDMQQTLFTF
jgi:hypothetical protein